MCIAYSCEGCGVGKFVEGERRVGVCRQGRKGKAKRKATDVFSAPESPRTPKLFSGQSGTQVMFSEETRVSPALKPALWSRNQGLQKQKELRGPEVEPSGHGLQES